MTREDAILKIVKSYPKLTGFGHLASYAVFGDGVDPYLVLNDICHKDLRHMDQGYTDMFTAFPVRHKRHLRFFSFMKYTLYRNFSKHLELVPVLLPKRKKPQYIIAITGLDELPANVLSNICICSRLIIEYDARVKVWDEMVDAGCDPSIAFALCHATLSNDDGNVGRDVLDKRISTVSVWGGHWPIETTVSLRALVDTGPGALSKPFKESPLGSFPTGLIWGSTTDLKKAIGLTVREFSQTWRTLVP